MLISLIASFFHQTQINADRSLIASFFHQTRINAIYHSLLPSSIRPKSMLVSLIASSSIRPKSMLYITHCFLLLSDPNQCCFHSLLPSSIRPESMLYITHCFLLPSDPNQCWYIIHCFLLPSDTKSMLVSLIASFFHQTRINAGFTQLMLHGMSCGHPAWRRSRHSLPLLPCTGREWLLFTPRLEAWSPWQRRWRQGRD